MKVYPIEKSLRTMANELFVVAFYDCCREKVASGPSRGGLEDGSDDSNEDDKGPNYIGVFGCPPT